MKELLQTAKIIVCVGSGGVGKTTVASAIAFSAAKMGRKVLVLTVDPAKRLKSTMGLDDNSEARIQHPLIKGELWASVIDAKTIFDNFVTEAAAKFYSNPEAAQKILRNKLYIQLSTNLSGSQEFTALEKLYSSVESKKYDLIVLDTPPTQHAIDFLQAPQKLAAIFNEKISVWLQDLGTENKGFFRNLLQSGTTTVLKALEALTGTEFVTELADFFRHIQKMRGTLEERINGAYRLLISPQTHFVLVTNFDEAKLKEAETFAKEIRKGGFQLSEILINRAYPKGLDLKHVVAGENSQWMDLYRSYQAYTLEKEAIYQSFSLRMKGRRLPELMNHISDLEGVAEMAENIEA